MRVEENKEVWDGKYHWADRGEEWSRPWGGVDYQWFGSIYPRIKEFLPVGHILEIACGYGRMTAYLKNHAERITAIDLSESCIQACRTRFADCPNVSLHVTDGMSLEMVSDHSVDFVFSYDSLVHADEMVLRAYIQKLPRILTPDGVAFLHHSNVGAYRERWAHYRRIPKLMGLLVRMGIVEQNLHWRDHGVDAAFVAHIARDAGLNCVRQEILRWRTRRVFNDCMTILVRPGSRFDRTPRTWRNSNFMMEAELLREIAVHYGGYEVEGTPR